MSVENQIKSTSHINEKIPIFFQSSYIDLHNYQEIHQLKDSKGLTLLGDLQNDVFYSLPFSPFGGVQSISAISYAVFSEFVDDVSTQLKLKGVKHIIIRQTPSIYPTHISDDWYIKKSFKVDYYETHQFIDLQAQNIMHKMELRKIAKAKKEALQFRELDGTELNKLYDFLAKARVQKGLKINITKSLFQELLAVFPTKYNGYIVEKNKEWYAGLLTVDVTDENTYYYLAGHDNKYQSYSPMAFLIHELIENLSSHKKYIDMGISSHEGQLQRGLFQFKKNMGALSYQKPVFRLEF